MFRWLLCPPLLAPVSPLSLEKLKINPAIASGPFIQIMNDIVGLIIYVYVATLFLKIFM